MPEIIDSREKNNQILEKLEEKALSSPCVSAEDPEISNNQIKDRETKDRKCNSQFETSMIQKNIQETNDELNLKNFNELHEDPVDYDVDDVNRSLSDMNISVIELDETLEILKSDSSSQDENSVLILQEHKPTSTEEMKKHLKPDGALVMSEDKSVNDIEQNIMFKPHAEVESSSLIQAWETKHESTKDTLNNLGEDNIKDITDLEINSPFETGSIQDNIEETDEKCKMFDDSLDDSINYYVVDDINTSLVDMSISIIELDETLETPDLDLSLQNENNVQILQEPKPSSTEDEEINNHLNPNSALEMNTSLVDMSISIIDLDETLETPDFDSSLQDENNVQILQEPKPTSTEDEEIKNHLNPDSALEMNKDEVDEDKDNEENIIFKPHAKVKSSILIQSWETGIESTKDNLNDLGEDEIKDIIDPGWDKYRNLTSEKEMFKNAMSVWNFSENSAPTTNLSYYGHLTKMGLKVGGKRLASNSPLIPNKKARLEKNLFIKIIDKKILQNNNVANLESSHSEIPTDQNLDLQVQESIQARRKLKPVYKTREHDQKPQPMSLEAQQTVSDILKNAKEESILLETFIQNSPTQQTVNDEIELKEMEKSFRLSYMIFGKDCLKNF